MIKAALEFLATKFAPLPDGMKTEDRTFLRNPCNWKEIRPQEKATGAFIDADGQPHRLGTLDSLIRFVVTHRDDGACQVIAGRSGATAYFNIQEDWGLETLASNCNRVMVPFIKPCDKHNFSYNTFLDFLDQHAERIKDFGALSAALKIFRTSVSSSTVIKESGAVITVSSAAEKGIEGSTATIPKEIVIDLPTGTREFLIPNVYILRITQIKRDSSGIPVVGEGEAEFTLTHKQRDGSWEAFIELAYAKLTAELPPEVLVLEGV